MAEQAKRARDATKASDSADSAAAEPGADVSERAKLGYKAGERSPPSLPLFLSSTPALLALLSIDPEVVLSTWVQVLGEWEVLEAELRHVASTQLGIRIPAADGNAADRSGT